MSALSISIGAHFSTHSIRSAISLKRKMCRSNQGSLAVVFQVRNLVRPMHLFGHNVDHDCCPNSPVKRSGRPNQLLGVLLRTMAISGLSSVRTELFHLPVIPSLARHPVETNRQSTGHGNLGNLPSPRSARWKNLPRHSGSLRTVPWAASTSRKRNSELPCLVMCPRRRRSPLDSSDGTSPK
jgi:hypothetical protein